jgi:hypothetical protein
MPTMERFYQPEVGAGSSPTGTGRKLVHYERFVELPYMNPALGCFRDLRVIHEWETRKLNDDKQKTCKENIRETGSKR